MTEPATTARALSERVVREAWAAEPTVARWSGEHAYDGRIGEVGPEAVRRRIAVFEGLAAELDALNLDRLDTELRADVRSARLVLAEDLMRVRDLRQFSLDPRRALDAAADVASYISRDYAPVADRAAALATHLEQLP